MVARCSFLGCDRPDIQCAAEEGSHWMSKPCRDDQEKAARIGEHLNSDIRCVSHIVPIGRDVNMVRASSDANFAEYFGARTFARGGVHCIGGA